MMRQYLSNRVSLCIDPSSLKSETKSFANKFSYLYLRQTSTQGLQSAGKMTQRRIISKSQYVPIHFPCHIFSAYRPAVSKIRMHISGLPCIVYGRCFSNENEANQGPKERPCILALALSVCLCWNFPIDVSLPRPWIIYRLRREYHHGDKQESEHRP